MEIIFYLGLLVLCCLNILLITDADHCDVKTDDHLALPKKEAHISLDAPDNCSLSYLEILNPLANPTDVEGCKIRGFHLKDGTIGPSCIPEIGNLKKKNLFSVNVESHQKEADLLLDVLLSCETFEDFKNAALYYKGKVNSMLFAHVFSSAIINRNDTSAFPVPSLFQIQPDLTFSSHVIQQANEKIKKDEKKDLLKYKKKEKDFKEINDIHEQTKYNRNEQTFHENRNNINFRPSKRPVATNHIEIVEESPHYFGANPHMSKDPEDNPIVSLPDSARKPIMVGVSFGEPVGFAAEPVEGQDAPEEMEAAEYEMDDAQPKTYPRDSPRANIFPGRKAKLPFIPPPVEKEFIVLEPDRTGNDKNPEHTLSYFREDVAINSHHWHWHAVYPMGWDNSRGHGIKSRKGELFYYMHNQMLKRYDGARLAAGLKFVAPLDIKESGTVIEEGYYPHLTSTSTGNSFSGRCRDLKLKNIDHSDDQGPMATLKDLVHWVKTIKKAIKDGHLFDKKGKKIPLRPKDGIDLLGSTIESSKMSVNKKKYGDIHNTGHILISFVHDTQGEFNAPPSVMYDTATALRDPVFWRWHKFVDDIFVLHKAKLPAYTNKELNFKDVHITHATVQTAEGSDGSYKPNTLYTYNRMREVELSKGLDLASNNAVTVKLVHLDHLAFTYAINVNSKSKRDIEGHVRIFISPKYTDKKKLATDEELRKHAIEMDRFTVKLNRGNNVITRTSDESAVTMTPGRQWSAMSNSNLEFKQKSGGASCGCGWPDHLLVPKGTVGGIDYILFIMVSNWRQEKNGEATTTRTCDDSLTMCGLLNQPFPDKNAMGFPLDRPFHVKKKWFNRENMIQKEITIYHLKSYKS